MTTAPTHLLVDRDGPVVTITMNAPGRRNALSRDHLVELLGAFRDAGRSDARGVVLAAEGPVFSAGHDFADMVDADLDQMRDLLRLCTEVMTTIQSIPQVVIARGTPSPRRPAAVGASFDLAVAAATAGFAVPGGKGGWFCTTPMVAVGRSVGRKQALELALTGDAIDAATAERWGLINRAVPDDALDAAVADLLGRAIRGSASSKALGKAAFYTQIGMDQPQANAYAIEVMAAASQTPAAREGVVASRQAPPALGGLPRARHPSRRGRTSPGSRRSCSRRRRAICPSRSGRSGRSARSGRRGSAGRWFSRARSGWWRDRRDGRGRPAPG
jgi:enoyl-CoA hydratase/carnithine racemase